MASKPEGWRVRVAGGRGSSPAATSSRQANTDRSRSRSPAGSHSAVTERKRIVVCEQNKQRLAHMLEAFNKSPLLAELGPQNMFWLAASSKIWQQEISTIACSDKRGLVLLDSAVATARSSSELKHMQAVGWLAALLLSKAPDTAGEVTTQLLNLPAVPLAVAVKLVALPPPAAGVRISSHSCWLQLTAWW